MKVDIAALHSELSEIGSRAWAGKRVDYLSGFSPHPSASPTEPPGGSVPALG